jgi:hypothetical protein
MLAGPHGRGLFPTPALANAIMGAYKLDHLLDGEAVRYHQRLSAAVAAGCEQFERTATVGPGAVAQMAKRGERGIGEREHAPSIGRGRVADPSTSRLEGPRGSGLASRASAL